MAFETGISTCGNKDENAEQFFRDCAENNVKYVELSPGRNCLENYDFESVGKWSDYYGITKWTFHLPFSPFAEIDPSSLDEEVRKHTLYYHSELIKKAAGIGVRKFIIHASREPIADDTRAQRLENACDTIGKLAEFAAGYDSVICVEDLPRTCIGNCSDDILRILSADDRLRCCFDTNHLLKQKNKDFIEKIGSKIVTVHVSDYDYIDEKHWLPGEGGIDWQELVAALKKVGYDGPWLYELGFAPTEKISRSRDLTLKDFCRNTEEIMSGKPLTIIK